jgi:hypothetical protein
MTPRPRGKWAKYAFMVSFSLPSRPAPSSRKRASDSDTLKADSSRADKASLLIPTSDRTRWINVMLSSKLTSRRESKPYTHQPESVVFAHIAPGR